MKYQIKDNTLVIEGRFEAISSGLKGGRGRAGCLFNHEVQPDFDNYDPLEYLENLAGFLDVKPPYFGLLTAVSMDNLCVMKDDYLTTFVTAGITHPSVFRVNRVGTINIILVVDGILSESAMVGTIITATEAKGLALMEMGYDFLGTTTDAVILAYQNVSGPSIEYAGSYTEFGEKIMGTVLMGVKEGIKNTEQSFSST
ncbi:MAG: adenosylcobinamide amidohydrolase [Methanosarcinaceae archaeon]|nr:adenosylcobinamide amidohydrolase [Methanosarcinaceae archaeon]